ncbi:MAG: radical SAM protein [Verrucomicrobiota bacterium]
MNIPLLTEELLKNTTGRCPVCHSACPAEVWKSVEGGKSRVFLRRTCPEHGETSNCISSDARFYWLAQGDPQNACCGGNACCAGEGGAPGTLGRNAVAPKGDAPFEKLATCLALIEIVNSCNLACPTCYADSQVGTGAKIEAPPLEDLKRRIEGVIERKGGIEILQLSGGEPTLHPEFFELLEWALAHEKIDYVLLNTNGVRIATDEAFASRLEKTFRYGGMQLYLQFDGVQAEGQVYLRGGDLREMRMLAIERCGAMNLPVTLAMTVTPDNLPHLWEAIEFGLKCKHVRGVAFQPMFGSGRRPQRSTRLNTADIILGAVGQSGGRLKFEDFTPLPCGDPNCATIGYLLKTPLGVRSISDFINFAEVQGFLRDKVRYSLDDLAKCGCENQPLGDLLKKFEMDETHTFRLFIKPFMDAWSWDEDRIDRCCTHVIRPDGKLDSFCRYYSGFAGK